MRDVCECREYKGGAQNKECAQSETQTDTPFVDPERVTPTSVVDPNNLSHLNACVCKAQYTSTHLSVSNAVCTAFSRASLVLCVGSVNSSAFSSGFMCSRSLSGWVRGCVCGGMERQTGKQFQDGARRRMGK